MGELVKETLELMMQIVTEKIVQDKDPLYWLTAWAEMAEEYGEL